METSKVFLTKIKKRIDNGEFNEDFALPFMSKTKLFESIEKKIKSKEEKGATPILSDNEIDEMIREMKEAAGTSFLIFKELGFLEKTEKGYQLSKRGVLAIKESHKIN